MESQLATIQAIWTQRNQANIVSDQVTTTPKECNVVKAPIASSIDVSALFKCLGNLRGVFTAVVKVSPVDSNAKGKEVEHL